MSDETLVILTDSRRNNRCIHHWARGVDEGNGCGGVISYCGRRFNLRTRELTWYFLPRALVNPAIPTCVRCLASEREMAALGEDT